MKKSALTLLAVLAAVVAACSPPKFVRYKSVSGDWAAFVPWGWSVIADADKDGFSEARFIGPFDPDFYLGAPSLSVRWYKRYRPHALRDGQLEMYSDADDFINQVVDQVYGKDAILYGQGQEARPDGSSGRVIVQRAHIPEVVLQESHLPAKYFGVLSPAPAKSGNRWGLEKDSSGRLFNVRYHEYVVIPMPSGFYVLCYPATKQGHDKGLKAFHALVDTFHPYYDGPGGQTFKLPPAPARR